LTDVYNRTQIDSSLALKANVADVYSKTLVDDYLALKANANNAIFTNLLQGQSADFSGNVSMGSALNVAGLLTAQDATFYGNINFIALFNVSGGMDVYGTSTFYGAVDFSNCSGLENVANTAPSYLPISNATQTALDLKANSITM
jgi:hypothetical protein